MGSLNGPYIVICAIGGWLEHHSGRPQWVDKMCNLGGGHLAEHELQHAAVGVVLPFLRRVDADLGLEGDGLAVGFLGIDRDLGGAFLDAFQIEDFGAVQA